MHAFELTVRNYRSFTEANPATIRLGPQFIAFVGSNNSGKTSLLRMFFELRNLWATIPSQLPNVLVEGVGFAIGYQGVFDNQEIFSDQNKGPISLEFKFSEPETSLRYDAPHVVRVVVRCFREKPTFWLFDIYSSANPNVPLRRAPKQHVSWKEPGVLELAATGVLDMRALVQLATTLNSTVYIGPFRNAITEGAASYYDLAVGTHFISTWNQWKTGVNKNQNALIQNVTTDIESIFEFRNLEINASHDQKTLSVFVDRRPYRLSELGAGFTQFVVVLGNAAIAQRALILIDEPELHLHPRLQIDFLTSLASYAKEGVIFATHSIGLARSVSDHIYAFRNTAEGTKVQPIERVASFAEFLGELSFSSYRELGFDRVLLVEGLHDVKLAQQFLRMLKKDHETVILPLGGEQLARGGVEHQLGEITRLSTNICALVDSEREQDGGPAKPSRVAFAESCNALGFRVCVTKWRAIENYLSDRAIKAVLGNKYRALGPYEALREAPLGWSKEQNWRIAREMSFDEIKDTDLGEILLAI